MPKPIRLFVLLFALQLVNVDLLFAGVSPANGKEGFSGKVFLIAVGINDYSKVNRFYNLLSPEMDAINFRERLKRDSSIKTVTAYNFDSRHSKADILNAFNEVAKLATPADAFIFFCAGQSFDGKLFLADSSTLTANELFSKSQSIYATRQLFFLDACHGEQFTGDLKRQLTTRPEESAIGNLNRIVLGVRGNAYEMRDGGVFTLSYTRSNIKMMDIFSKWNRLQVRVLNDLYTQIEKMIPTMTIDFFSEKEFYTAVVPERASDTRSTITGTATPGTSDKKKVHIRKGETLSLLIGCKNFSYFSSLTNTLNDAREIKQVLENNYWQKTILMEDPTFVEFREMLFSIKEDYEFEEGSQFMFYAATHGAKDENGTGTMVFKDSKLEGKFLDKTYSLTSIKKAISQLNCTNSLMLIDICHSGTMFDDGTCVRSNAIEIPETSPIFTTKGTDGPAFKNFLNQKTNIFIGSSTDQEAADGKTGHSPFAAVVIRFLQQNNLPVIDSYHLQAAIQQNVMKEGAISIPMFCTYACKDDGRFLFIRK
jgi:hypothetical protein